MGDISEKSAGRTNSTPMERDYGNGHDYLDSSVDETAALHRIRTAGSIAITPELFEKLYLSPQNKVSGDLRKTVGNPTPVALVGFLLSLTPLSCMLMGWRGSGGNGAADTAAYFFFGGVLMLAGGLGEFLLGNTFPCVVFMTFGAFWLTYGGTLQPFYNSAGAYSSTGSQAEGFTEPAFFASFAFFLLWMGVLCLILSILALRTNIVLFFIIFLLVPSFSLLAASFWQAAEGNKAASERLQKAGGGVLFIICMLGWYVFTAVMMASTDFPLSLPVGDLSVVIKGASQKKPKDEHMAA